MSVLKAIKALEEAHKDFLDELAEYFATTAGKKVKAAEVEEEEEEETEGEEEGEEEEEEEEEGEEEEGEEEEEEAEEEEEEEERPKKKKSSKARARAEEEEEEEEEEPTEELATLKKLKKGTKVSCYTQDGKRVVGQVTRVKEDKVIIEFPPKHKEWSGPYKQADLKKYMVYLA